MSELLTFDDVLIEPHFSMVKSRKDVSLYNRIHLWGLDIPVISSNMDTITGIDMANEMNKLGAGACLHRFWSIEENVEAFMASPLETIVSFGIGDHEKERVEALYGEKASVFCLDVAHGAQISVVEQVKWFKEKYPECLLIVGNFASGKSLDQFNQALGNRKLKPDAVKVGIGPGSACTTRIKTGCGMPQLSAIMDVRSIAKRVHIPVIADGGMKTSGDITKALAAGAQFVMLGGMLAGTTETPGFTHPNTGLTPYDKDYIPEDRIRIKYRGSASKESYESQGKDEAWRTAEGEAFTVPYKGPVRNVIQDIEGGLRSAFTYVGANNLHEFQERATLIKISNATKVENGAHGKN